MPDSPTQPERVGPFILVADNDRHWYVIPKAKRVRWEVWLHSEEAELGDIPDYAQPVGGAPSRVEFMDFTLS